MRWLINLWDWIIAWTLGSWLIDLPPVTPPDERVWIIVTLAQGHYRLVHAHNDEDEARADYWHIVGRDLDHYYWLVRVLQYARPRPPNEREG